MEAAAVRMGAGMGLGLGAIATIILEIIKIVSLFMK